LKEDHDILPQDGTFGTLLAVFSRRQKLDVPYHQNHVNNIYNDLFDDNSVVELLVGHDKHILHQLFAPLENVIIKEVFRVLRDHVNKVLHDCKDVSEVI